MTGWNVLLFVFSGNLSKWTILKKCFLSCYRSSTLFQSAFLRIRSHFNGRRMVDSNSQYQHVHIRNRSCVHPYGKCGHDAYAGNHWKELEKGWLHSSTRYAGNFLIIFTKWNNLYLVTLPFMLPNPYLPTKLYLKFPLEYYKICYEMK